MATVAGSIVAPWTDGTEIVSIGNPYTRGPAPPGYVGPAPSLAPTFVIPAAGTYNVQHSVDVRDLRDDSPVQFTSLTISTDDGSVCWTLNASGGPELFTRFSASDELGVVSVVIDGMEWQFLVETVRRSREFGQTSVTVTGRSITISAAEPYAYAKNWINEGPATAAQLVDQAQVFTQLQSMWLLEDWLVPDKVWTFTGSPLAVAQRVAESVSAVVVSARAALGITIMPRYKALPYEWPGIAPDVEIHADATMTDSYERADKPAYNAVYVSGQQQGVVGRVYLNGTAADKVAPLVTDLLLTDFDGVRQRGMAILGAAGPQARVQMTLPVLVVPPAPGVLELGQICRIVGDGDDWWGVVRSVSVNVTLPSALQTVIFERHAPTTEVPVEATTSGNFDPTVANSTSLSNANKTVTIVAGSNANARSVTAHADKRYFEFEVAAVPAGVSPQALMGFGTLAHPLSLKVGYDLFSIAYDNLGIITFNGGNPTTVAGHVASDVVMLAYDGATGKFWAGKNGAWFNGANPSAGTGYVGIGPVGAVYVLRGGDFNAPPPSVSATGHFTAADLVYSAPAGFLPWN